MKRRHSQPGIQWEHADLLRRLCVLPFLTTLPLLLLLSLLTREGWKAVVALGIAFVVVVVIVILRRRTPNPCDQLLRRAGDQNKDTHAHSQSLRGNLKVED